jgi:lysophospholipase L1-like esterase
MTLVRLTFFLAATALSAGLSHAAEGALIETFDAPKVTAAKEKAHFETVEGKDGKALKCSFEDGCAAKFLMTRVRGTPEWDNAAGFSFWVKGDGSNKWGGLEFIWNDDYGVRYDYCFPIDSTEWKKITVAWRDLVPNLPKPNTNPLDPKTGNAPSKLSALWFGKFFFWRDYAAHSYVIDELRLEPVIELDTRDYKPAGDPLARVKAKLKAGQPITVVTMGDSLTDYNHWANKAVPNWPTFFTQAAKEQFKSTVTINNPAIGGTQLRQGLITLPRWLKETPEPDLVTVFYGGNDYGDGMRGPLFELAQRDAVERIRRATKGKADVMLLTTAQGLEKWDQHSELAEATRKAAQQTNTALCDIFAAYNAVPDAERAQIFCRDKVHMGKLGHEIIAKAVLEMLSK